MGPPAPRVPALRGAPEALDRLYLNAERAREEQRLGLAGKKKGRAVSEAAGAGDEAEAPAPKKAGKGAKKAPGKQGTLF
ncbi:hypothetical protein [Polyangium fumosum]|uniref:Uncharacterized protein n=1 Tax=Polyangium fumosum TaxID=889272 RepID=A0A4U1IQK7_9BACT|nr:hypothetical protein [Polyangium fumosum]TKC96501.1 hypothetical protein E8A74_45015 [Polyangium fumosum]